jgi:hypothetical protein
VQAHHQGRPVSPRTRPASPEDVRAHEHIPVLQLGRAEPRADLAHLRPEPVLAQSPKLDEGQREGQAGENCPDCRDDRPDHGTMVVELAPTPRPQGKTYQRQTPQGAERIIRRGAA